MNIQAIGLSAMLTASCVITGCSGFNQFPAHPVAYKSALGAMDPDYAQAANDSLKNDPVSVRNVMIDERRRVIDLHFLEYQQSLARENVAANFGVAAAQIIMGGVGAVVSETASQILSAASGGLAGIHQAYGKAALFEQTMPALLAQMIASRNAILVKINAGRRMSIVDYSLADAAADLQAYYFAGSLPGALIATSADAKVKNDEATRQLEALRNNVFSQSDTQEQIRTFIRPPDGDPSRPVDAMRAKNVLDWIERSPVKGLALANFLTNKELEPLRLQMIRDLNIPVRR